MAQRFSLAALLGDQCPTIRVVDVGAMSLGQGTEPYHPLVSLGKAEVVGFEPIQEECDRLNKAGKPGQQFLPFFIGDGSPGTFRQCNFNMTSSLFEPNLKLARLFNNLAELMIPKSRESVLTRRLDDIAEVGQADLLKIDVQGAELGVIEGAERLLRACTVVHTEVEFVPLYEGQPLFADVDAAMRKAGYLLHSFPNIAKRAFKPVVINRDPNLGLNQVVWGDAVYVRDFTRLDALTPEQLLKMALILHEVYGSYDLVQHTLAEHKRQTASPHWGTYMTRLTGRPHV